MPVHFCSCQVPTGIWSPERVVTLRYAQGKRAIRRLQRVGLSCRKPRWVHGFVSPVSHSRRAHRETIVSVTLSACRFRHRPRLLSAPGHPIRQLADVPLTRNPLRSAVWTFLGVPYGTPRESGFQGATQSIAVMGVVCPMEKRGWRDHSSCKSLFIINSSMSLLVIR